MGRIRCCMSSMLAQITTMWSRTRVGRSRTRKSCNACRGASCVAAVLRSSSPLRTYARMLSANVRDCAPTLPRPVGVRPDPPRAAQPDQPRGVRRGARRGARGCAEGWGAHRLAVGQNHLRTKVIHCRVDLSTIGSIFVPLGVSTGRARPLPGSSTGRAAASRHRSARAGAPPLSTVPHTRPPTVLSLTPFKCGGARAGGTSDSWGKKQESAALCADPLARRTSGDSCSGDSRSGAPRCSGSCSSVAGSCSRGPSAPAAATGVQGSSPTPAC